MFGTHPRYTKTAARAIWRGFEHAAYPPRADWSVVAPRIGPTVNRKICMIPPSNAVSMVWKAQSGTILMS